MRAASLTAASPRLLRPTRDQVLNIRANFCGMQDAQGRAMFTDFLGGLPRSEREDWYARQRAAGLTHLVICTNAGPYHWWHAPTYDFRHDPAQFRALLLDVLGHGFVPVVMMTSGDDQTWHEILGEVWAGLWPAVRDLQGSCVWANGYETGGAWPSKAVSDTLRWMQAHMAPETVIAQECIPERGTAASWPVQPDDPWRGDEIGMWKSCGGERVNVFLYETGHGSGFYDFAPRWHDIVPRLGMGQHTWRKMERICFFETGAENFFDGTDGVDAHQLQLAAQSAQAIAESYGLTTLTFGNGVP